MIPSLQVLICTTARRIGGIDVSAFPAVRGVEYVISCQNPDSLPVGDISGARRDVSVHFFRNTGLSNNRNNAFGVASAPYLLIADDDLSFEDSGLKEIIRRFESDPELGLLTVRARRPGCHVYPPDGHDLTKPCRFYEPLSFEIAVRRSAILEHGLRFSPLAGIGSPVLIAGEENLFVHHCLRAGIKGRFADAEVATHPDFTTGFRMAGTPAMLFTKGAVNRIVRGNVGTLLRIPLMCLREPAPFFRAFRNLMGGFFYAGRHRNEL